MVEETESLVATLVNEKVEDIALFCSSDDTLCFLKSMILLLNEVFSIKLTVHSHSSLFVKPQEKMHKDLLGVQLKSELPLLHFSLIWHKGETCLRFTDGTEINGHVNIVRYMTRLIENRNPELLRYESLGAEFAAGTDTILASFQNNELDKSQKIENLCKKEVESKKSKYYFGKEMSLVDVFCKDFNILYK